MKHYDIIQWVDFARDAIPAEERAAIERHLSAGCADCQASLALLQKVVSTARADAGLPVSAELTQAAKEIFAIAKPRAEPLLRRVFGILKFDSFAELLPEGARTGVSESRHVMFQAGDYCLDLRLENEADSIGGALVGQIFGQNGVERQVGAVPVMLMAGKKVVTRTMSNEFGEFILEYVPVKKLRLCVTVDQAGQQLEVSLSRFAAER